jgi:hypothetical protein
MERLTAKECAARWGHTPRWWRDRKELFTAEPQGDGDRPRLLFSTARIERIRAERQL